eukprot:7828913-Pyramimonas_sp.AAC.1
MFYRRGGVRRGQAGGRVVWSGEDAQGGPQHHLRTVTDRKSGDAVRKGVQDSANGRQLSATVMFRNPRSQAPCGVPSGVWYAGCISIVGWRGVRVGLEG